MNHPAVKHPKHFLKERQGLDKFNRAVAVRLGNSLGSMPFFWICVVLDLAELPAVIAANNVIVWVTYISQAVIQLIALPILSVQQNIQAEKKDASDQAVHEALTHIATQVDNIEFKITK